MTDRLIKAAKAYRDAQAAVAKAKKRLAEANETVRQVRPELADAIVDEARAGTRQAEIARLTGYTRENIRKICRAAGVEAAE